MIIVVLIISNHYIEMIKIHCGNPTLSASRKGRQMVLNTAHLRIEHIDTY